MAKEAPIWGACLTVGMVYLTMTQALNCEDIFSDQLCLINPRCIWNEFYHVCHDKQNKVPCFGIPDEFECRSNPHCDFNEDVAECLVKGARRNRFSPYVLLQVHFQPANIIVLEQLAILRPTASSTKTIFIAMKRVVMHLADILPTNLPVQQFQIAAVFLLVIVYINFNHPYVYALEWIPDEQYCIDPDSRICHEMFTQHICEILQGCNWNEESQQCLSHGLQESCDFVREKEACNLLPKCEWMEDKTFCKHKDLPIPCYRHIDKQSCDHDPGCVFNSGAGLCHQPGREGCTSDHHCRYDERLKACIGANEEVTCNRYVEQESCLLAGCAFRNQVCLDEDKFFPCDTLDGMYKCQKYGCEFDFESGECRDPADQSTEERLARRGIEQQLTRDALRCDEVKCGVLPYCIGDETLATPLYACCPRCSLPMDVCLRFSDESSCPDKCEWHRAAFACTSIGGLPPCMHLFDDQLCKKRNDCEWHDAAHSCTPTGERPSCDRFFEARPCLKSGCAWNAPGFICHEKDKEVPCMHLSAEVCLAQGNRCHWDSHAGVCHAAETTLPCALYRDERSCRHHKNRCEYVSGTAECIPKGESPSCSAFSRDACDAQSHCSYDVELGQCTENYDFESLLCDEHQTEDECVESNQCFWSEAALGCFPKGTDVPCNRIFDKSNCPTDRCKWEPVAFRCLSKGERIQCAYLQNKQLCLEAGCDFHDTEDLCTEPDEEVACRFLKDENTCSTRLDCSWSDDGRFCSEQHPAHVCLKQSSEEACKSNPFCHWLPDERRCFKPQEPVQCSEFMYHSSCKSLWDMRRHKCRLLKTPRHVEL
eukprot:gene2987-5778_t